MSKCFFITPEEGSSETPSLYSWMCNDFLRYQRTLSQARHLLLLLLHHQSVSLDGVSVAGGRGTKQCLGTADNGPTWTWEREGNDCHNAWKPPTGDFKIRLWIQLAVCIHSHTHTHNEQSQEACHSSKTYVYIKENCSTHALKPFLKQLQGCVEMKKKYNKQYLLLIVWK